MMSKSVDRKVFKWNTMDDAVKQWELFEEDLKQELTSRNGSYLRVDALQANYNPPLNVIPARP